VPPGVPPAPDELSSPVAASSGEVPPLLDVDPASGLPPLELPPDEEEGMFKPDPPLEELPDEDPLLVEDPPVEELLLFDGVMLGCIVPLKLGVFDDPHAATTAARQTPTSIA
jgi:hypothetical protein